MAATHIYILSAITVHRNTKEDIQQARNIHNLTYHRNDDLPHYLKWLCTCHRLRYDIQDYDTAYFLDKKKAIDYATSNMADINESGAYPYLAVFSRPIDTMYADASNGTVHVFTFDMDTQTYREVNLEDHPMYLAIASHYNCTFQNHPALKETPDMYDTLPTTSK